MQGVENFTPPPPALPLKTFVSWAPFLTALSLTHKHETTASSSWPAQHVAAVSQSEIRSFFCRVTPSGWRVVPLCPSAVSFPGIKCLALPWQTGAPGFAFQLLGHLLQGARGTSEKIPGRTLCGARAGRGEMRMER